MITGLHRYRIRKTSQPGYGLVYPHDSLPRLEGSDVLVKKQSRKANIETRNTALDRGGASDYSVPHSIREEHETWNTRHRIL